MQFSSSAATWLGPQIHLEAIQRESYQATRRIELRPPQPPARYPARYPNGGCVYVRDMVQRGILKVAKVPTNLNVSDILTKAVDKATFVRHRDTIVSN